MHDDLDLNLEPSEPSVPDVDQGGVSLPQGEVDHEGAMAKADLYKLANYSLKLFKKIQDGDQLEGWVQAKITKAADYIASVYHYLEYEMQFSEYGQKLDDSDVLSESQKAVLKNKLMEAKAKIKELKVTQAEKQFGQVDEGILSGGEQSCPECGGSGVVVVAPRAVPEELKSKVKSYNRKAKAYAAATKRIDANKNGIPDDEEFNEAGDDEPAAPNADAIAKKKAREAAQRRREEKADDDADDLSKDYTPKSEKSSSSRKVGGKAYGGEKQKDAEVDEGQGGIYGKGVYEGKSKKAKPDFLDMDKDGNKKETMKKAVADKKKGAVKEAEEKRAPAKKTEREVNLPSGAKGKITKVQGWQSQKAEKAAEKEKGLDESDDHYDDYRKKKMADRLARGISPDEASKFDRTTTTKKGTFSKKVDRYDPETGKLVKQNVGRSKTNETEEKRAPAKKTTRTVDLPSGAKGKITKVQGWQSQKAEKAAEKEKDLGEQSAPLTPQQAAELVKSSDPNAYNKLKGIPTPKKTTPVVSPNEGPTQASKPAVVKESAELERMKEFLARLNG